MIRKLYASIKEAFFHVQFLLTNLATDGSSLSGILPSVIEGTDVLCILSIKKCVKLGLFLSSELYFIPWASAISVNTHKGVCSCILSTIDNLDNNPISLLTMSLTFMARLYINICVSHILFTAISLLRIILHH